MKAKVKRGTAAGNLYCGLSTLCDVTCHLKLCETIATDCVCTRFGWKEAMIQQAYNFCLWANSSVQSTVRAITVRSWSSIALLVAEIRIFFGLLTYTVVTGFLFVFISFVAAWRNDVMTCINVPELCYRHVCRHDLCCLAVSTRNRLCDGSFEGGLDGIWTGISWMLRVLVETVKYRSWIALFSTRDLDSRPNSSCLGRFGSSTICAVPEAFAVALGGFDGGWMILDIC